jgi:hypothetical protein
MAKTKDAIGQDPMKTEWAGLGDLDKSKQASLSAPKPKRKTNTEVRNRLKEAERNTEIRRAVRELSAKMNDLEIQFDRRLEELQILIVKLTKALDLKGD